mmetsp:Transcript_18085/g.59081  ORF Transcript_18085/g.59081 Transcript_18085/m.59081 type:complete len:303 (-) Transcript_18085:5-913(-)
MRDGVSGAPVEPKEAHLDALVERKEEREEAARGEVFSVAADVCGEVSVEGEEGRSVVVVDVLEVAEEPCLGLHLLHAHLIPFVPRDVLRVDEAERGARPDVAVELRLEVRLVVLAAAVARARRGCVEADDGVVRVDERPVLVHHRQARVANHRARHEERLLQRVLRRQQLDELARQHRLGRVKLKPFARDAVKVRHEARTVRHERRKHRVRAVLETVARLWVGGEVHPAHLLHVRLVQDELPVEAGVKPAWQLARLLALRTLPSSRAHARAGPAHAVRPARNVARGVIRSLDPDRRIDQGGG